MSKDQILEEFQQVVLGISRIYPNQRQHLTAAMIQGQQADLPPVNTIEATAKAYIEASGDPTGQMQVFLYMVEQASQQQVTQALDNLKNIDW